MKNNDNMALWKSANWIDPKRVKKFNKAGFSGTAVDPQYLIERATETFGPLGIGWGFDIEGDQFVPGGDLIDAQGVVVGKSIIHVVRINLWYVWKEEKGSVRSYGQTTFVGKDKRGVITDEEAPKKSLTDAISKALSWLGFGADIRYGKFDDHKYVSRMAAEAIERYSESGDDLSSVGPLTEDEKASFIKSINEATNLEAVRDIWKKVVKRTARGDNDKDSYEELGKLAGEKQRKFAGSK